MNAHDKTHLTLVQRLQIEQLLNYNSKLKDISNEIGKDERTISKEIRKHLVLTSNKKLTGTTVKPNELRQCKRLLRFPYCCNGCLKRIKCYLPRFLYVAEEAQKTYQKVLTTTRSGIKMNELQFEQLDRIVKDGVSRGLSPYALYSLYPESFGCSLKTVYNYIEKGILQTKNIDLRRKVSFKPKK